MSIRRSNTGFTLIEVMIGIVVVAVGLLMVAGLQLVSKRSSYDAVQRSGASMLAHDLAARMRTNRVGLAGYITPVSSPLTGTSSAPGSNCSPGQPCSPGQLAAYDLWEFDQAIAGAQETRTEGNATLNTGGLVNVSACVSGPVVGGAGLYRIVIAWRGTTPLQNPTIHPCGSGSGLYGDNDEYRRVLVLPAFIS